MEPVLSAGAPATRLRVMIVTDQYEPMIGGVPTVTKELAAGLAGRGHAVAVVAPSATRHGHGHGHGAANSVTVDFRGSLPWPWYEGQRLGVLPPARAGALISAFKPDVVHLHSPLTLGAAARPAARRRHVPVVYTNHYLPLNVWPTAGRPWRARDAAFYAYVTGFANRCDLVTAPTATALRLLREHGLRTPSQAVSNGVDLDRFRAEAAGRYEAAALRFKYDLPAGRPLVLSVGRLSVEKRADVLIAALARLPHGNGARDVDAGAPVLVLAGTGPDAGRLRSLARHYGVGDLVRFPGFVTDDDLPGLYRLADVFAIASPAELQSLVTMEAMASGLPVVAVDAGALSELVHPGENGFLAAPGNAAEIADSLALLSRDADLRARMSKASLRIIGGHDGHRLLSRWESIYRALASHEMSEARDSRTAEQAKVSDGQP